MKANAWIQASNSPYFWRDKPIDGCNKGRAQMGRLTLRLCKFVSSVSQSFGGKLDPPALHSMSAGWPALNASSPEANPTTSSGELLAGKATAACVELPRTRWAQFLISLLQSFSLRVCLFLSATWTPFQPGRQAQVELCCPLLFSCKAMSCCCMRSCCSFGWN